MFVYTLKLNHDQIKTTQNFNKTHTTKLRNVLCKEMYATVRSIWDS